LGKPTSGLVHVSLAYFLPIHRLLRTGGWLKAESQSADDVRPRACRARGSEELAKVEFFVFIRPRNGVSFVVTVIRLGRVMYWEIQGMRIQKHILHNSARMMLGVELSERSGIGRNATFLFSRR
jgi:hypothetical protein